MKRFLPFAVVLITAASAFAQGTAQTPYVPPYLQTISVTGTGRSTVTPDRVTFSVGVQTIAATVDEAVNENNRKVAAVIAALKAAGELHPERRGGILLRLQTARDRKMH